MESAPIRLVVADNHHIVHTGMERLLADAPHIQRCGSVHSFADLMESPVLAACDVLLLDLHGMGVGPIMMITALRRTYPALSIVIFSSSVDLAPEMLRAGALGYVVKDDMLGDLVAAIDHAHAGTPYLSPIAQRYVARVQARGQVDLLTDRELETVKLVAQTLPPPDIATHLSITPNVLRNKLSTLYRKTGCRDRAELAAWYRRRYGSDALPE